MERSLAPETIRTGLSADALQRAVLDNLMYLQARYPQIATAHDWYKALAYSVRDRLLARWGWTPLAPRRWHRLFVKRFDRERCSPATFVSVGTIGNFGIEQVSGNLCRSCQ